MVTREKNKITHMHFIMSVLVILIHSINNDTKFERFFSVETGIGQFAVPLFFIISGFLFFRNINSIDTALNKVRNRVYTLLIPYLLWNLIYYAIHLLLKPGSGISLYSIIDAAFNFTYNPSFWFMNQLILLTFISPVIYYILNINKFPILKTAFLVSIAPFVIYVLLLVLFVLVLFGVDIPYINEDAFIYYVFGLIFSKFYNKNKFEIISKKNLIKCVLLFVTVFIINRIIHIQLLTNINYYNLFTMSIIIVRVVGAMVLFYFFDLFLSYENVPKYMGQTFFLYAIHYAIVKCMIIFMKYFTYSLVPFDLNINGISLVVMIEWVVFILSPFVCVRVNYYLSRFFIKKNLKAYNLLVGNRS